MIGKDETILVEFKTENVPLVIELVQQAAKRNRKNAKNRAAYLSVMRDIEDALEQEMEHAERQVRQGIEELTNILLEQDKIDE